MKSTPRPVPNQILKRLQVIPGVGPRLAEELAGLGYTDVSELAGEDPEAMYARLIELNGRHVDRCVLYVFRCAVYFASNDKHESDKLKWWTWKD